LNATLPSPSIKIRKESLEPHPGRNAGGLQQRVTSSTGADSILFRIEDNHFLLHTSDSILNGAELFLPLLSKTPSSLLLPPSSHCEMYFTTPIISSCKLASLALLLLGLHPSAVNSVTFDCKQVVIGDVKLDLSPLTGPHSVSMLQRTPTAIKNTTFTIDICKPLYKSGDKPKSAECPNGSRG
jgi:hypothetical protein